MNNPEHHISSVQIINFKKFDSLQVSNLGQFNLVVGDNNIGKTSFLEALLFDEMFGEWLGNLIGALEYRSINISDYHDENVFEFYFHEVAKPFIEIKYSTQNGRQNSLKFDTKPSATLSKEQLENLNLKNLGRQPNKFAALFYKNDILNDIEFVKDMYVANSTYMPFLSNATIFGTDLVNFYSENIQKKKSLKENFIRRLSSLLPELENIEISGPNQKTLLITLKNQDDAKIINQYGEGTIKLLRILLEIYMCRDKRIMIDEIGTGIHYSKMTDFFELIISDCISNNVQFFATTHSKECIESYVQALKNLDLKADGRIVRIAQTAKGIKAYTNTFEQFDTALIAESELR